jgi:hypothetical protein
MSARDWMKFASHLQGRGFALFQRELTRYNHHRFEPALPEADWRDAVRDEYRVLQAEGEFVEALRCKIGPLVADVPDDVDGFIAWFEALRDSGPGQGDPLFPWLAEHATLPQLQWFVEQEPGQDFGAGQARNGTQLLG